MRTVSRLCSSPGMLGLEALKAPGVTVIIGQVSWAAAAAAGRSAGPRKGPLGVDIVVVNHRTRRSFSQYNMKEMRSRSVDAALFYRVPTTSGAIC